MERAREEAAIGWDLAPVTTARLAAETWNAIKGEPWSLAVSDRIPWARRLWPATEYHHMLGGSGAQGVGYAAPGALGVALANKTRGRFTVTFQPDGDLMYSPGVLWTAAYHKIPILYVMHNNRAYHQEIMHVQRMTALHNRDPTRRAHRHGDRQSRDRLREARAIHGRVGRGADRRSGEARPRARARGGGGEIRRPGAARRVCQGR